MRPKLAIAALLALGSAACAAAGGGFGYSARACGGIPDPMSLLVDYPTELRMVGLPTAIIAFVILAVLIAFPGRQSVILTSRKGTVIILLLSFLVAAIASAAAAPHGGGPCDI